MPQRRAVSPVFEGGRRRGIWQNVLIARVGPTSMYGTGAGRSGTGLVSRGLELCLGLKTLSSANPVEKPHVWQVLGREGWRESLDKRPEDGLHPYVSGRQDDRRGRGALECFPHKSQEAQKLVSEEVREGAV